jgi:transposase-like protein
MAFIHFAGEIMGILSPDIQAQILAFHYSDKRSIKSIARECGVDPKTVRRVVKRREVHLEARVAKRGSILDPFKTEIDELLKKDSKITNTSTLNYIRARVYTGGIPY